MDKLKILCLVCMFFSVQFQVLAAEIFKAPSYCQDCDSSLQKVTPCTGDCSEDTAIKKLEELNIDVEASKLSDALYDTAMKGMISHRLLMRKLYFPNEDKRNYGAWRSCTARNESKLYNGVNEEVKKISPEHTKDLGMMFKVQKLLSLIGSKEKWKKRNEYIQDIYSIEGDGKNMLPPSATFGINKSNKEFINRRKGLIKVVYEGMQKNKKMLFRAKSKKEKDALYKVLETQGKYLMELKSNLRKAKAAVKADAPYGINHMDPFMYDFSSFMDNFKEGDQPILEYKKYKQSDFGKDTLKLIRSLKTESGKTGDDFLATIQTLLDGDEEDKSTARMMAIGMLMDKKVGPVFENEMRGRLKEQFKALDANVLELCKNKHKKKKHHLLHFNQKLVKQYIASQDPTVKESLQKAHCQLIEKHPLPSNIKAALLGAGMFVAGIASAPFSGPMGLALIFTGVGTYFTAVGIKDYADVSSFHKEMNGLREIGMAEVEQVRNIMTEKRLMAGLMVLDVALMPLDIAAINAAKKTTVKATPVGLKAIRRFGKVAGKKFKEVIHGDGLSIRMFFKRPALKKVLTEVDKQPALVKELGKHSKADRGIIRRIFAAIRHKTKSSWEKVLARFKRLSKHCSI